MSEKMEDASKISNIVLRPLINRELSWMAFNDRVLEEATDTTIPLLERLKFLAIVSSNLDEFFMIRVAGLERRVQRKSSSVEDDGLRTDEVLYMIREWALSQKNRQGAVLRDLLEKLKAKDLYLQTHIGAQDVVLLERAKSLLPPIKVQTFNNLETLHTLTGSRIFVFVRLTTKFAILGWDENIDRLIRLPDDLAKTKHHYILLEKLLVAAAQQFFEDPVLEAFPFKLIRDAEVKIDPNTDPEELLNTVEQALENRQKLPVVRLEVDAPNLSDGAMLMATAFKLHTRTVYRYDVPMDLRILWRIHGLEGFESLRHAPASKTLSEGQQLQRVPDLVKIIRGQDVLLHHPYDSFDTVVNLLQVAAKDPNVVAIKQTVYRAGRNSPVVDALVEAAKQGKNVEVFIELRARFDEALNIKLAKDLKKAGVNVLKAFPDKKIHCKITQIQRKEGDAITSFVHVGTGNYNPTTANLYTDLGLLTADPAFGRDADKLFQSLQGGKQIARSFEAFVTAPVQLQKKLMEWIQSETARAKTGDKNARIIVKVNSLVDPHLINALYEASNAGVKIDLIVRSACCLRPGVPGMSENIRVISIVEKYLEHSRIYFFQNGEDSRIYLSSADWMPRNMYQRIEIAFPIRDVALKSYVRDTILETYLKDNQKARQLQPDGSWLPVRPKPEEPPFRAQVVFEKLAKNNYRGTPLAKRFILQKEDGFEKLV